MPRVRSAPLSCTFASEAFPAAVIVRDAAHIDKGFDRTGFTELLGMLGRIKQPEPTVVIAADGPVPQISGKQEMIENLLNRYMFG